MASPRRLGGCRRPKPDSLPMPRLQFEVFVVVERIITIRSRKRSTALAPRNMEQPGHIRETPSRPFSMQPAPASPVPPARRLNGVPKGETYTPALARPVACEHDRIVASFSSPMSAPLPWLVADIGGTNARFGWIGHADAPIEHVHTLDVRGYVGPVEAAEAYLALIARDLGSGAVRPKAAALAVATAVVGDEVVLTNSAWRFSCARTRQALGVKTLRVLNDFEAMALALPRLGPGQWRAHADDPRPGAGVLAVVGPGTGLGVGAAVRAPGGWVALPGEGGHATLAATDEDEARVLAHARQWFGHVSGERLLSGIGLPVLHRAVCAATGAAGTGALTTPQIVERGLDGSDLLARRTLEMFCALLGNFCGSVALTYGARGGLFVGGGIVPRLGGFFFTSAFRQKFEAKGRSRDYLASVPTAVIIDTLAALTGSRAVLEGVGPDICPSPGP
jgi:glucokinase